LLPLVAHSIETPAFHSQGGHGKPIGRLGSQGHSSKSLALKLIPSFSDILLPRRNYRSLPWINTSLVRDKSYLRLVLDWKRLWITEQTKQESQGAGSWHSASEPRLHSVSGYHILGETVGRGARASA
jgi:hypothetical protein